jgi:hypothetical protein
MSSTSSTLAWACAVGLLLAAYTPARAQDTRQEAELYQRLLESSVWVVLPASSRPGLLVYDEGSGWVLDVKGTPQGFLIPPTPNLPLPTSRSHLPLPAEAGPGLERAAGAAGYSSVRVTPARPRTKSGP